MMRGITHHFVFLAQQWACYFNHKRDDSARFVSQSSLWTFDKELNVSSKQVESTGSFKVPKTLRARANTGRSPHRNVRREAAAGHHASKSKGGTKNGK